MKHVVAPLAAVAALAIAGPANAQLLSANIGGIGASIGGSSYDYSYPSSYSYSYPTSYYSNSYTYPTSGYYSNSYSYPAASYSYPSYSYSYSAPSYGYSGYYGY